MGSGLWEGEPSGRRPDDDWLKSLTTDSTRGSAEASPSPNLPTVSRPCHRAQYTSFGSNAFSSTVASSSVPWIRR